MTTNSQAGIEDKILTSASASVWALSIWPRPGLCLVNLAWKMCYQMLNNIGFIHFVVVSLQHSLQMLSTLMWDINSFMCCCHCRHVPCVLSQKYLHVAGLDLDPWPRRHGLGLASTSWFLPRPRPRPRPCLSLGLDVLASFNITANNLNHEWMNG